MTDLTANVTFGPSDDGWTLDQRHDVFLSVQAWIGHELGMELWGRCSLESPDFGAGRELFWGVMFQQISRFHVGRRWEVTRWVFGLGQPNIGKHGVHGAVAFHRHGSWDAMATARRI